MSPGPRWPDWFLAGAPRCGTTALFDALREHPQLHLPAHKDPHLFGTDLGVRPHTVRDPAICHALFEGAFATSSQTPPPRCSAWWPRSVRATGWRSCHD